MTVCAWRGTALSIALAGALSGGLSGACLGDLEPAAPAPAAAAGPCANMACSQNGYCNAGQCYCDTGYFGDPNALYGCQGTFPGSDCITTCGLNAYCDDGACRCVDGFVAACNSGDCLAEAQVCDGTPDCNNGVDELPGVCEVAVVQNWIVTDECDDGEPLRWRLWAQERGWVWPNPDEDFVTTTLGLPMQQAVECVMGETICLGAEAGGQAWGVGLDAALACEGCCFPCGAGTMDYGGLRCG